VSQWRIDEAMPGTQTAVEWRVLILNIVSGALIPTFAGIIFNILNIFVDAFPSGTPNIASSAFDISSGCVFAIVGLCVVGLCVSVKSREKLLSFVILITLLFLAMVLGDVLYFIIQTHRVPLVLTVDLIAFSALCWAIYEVVHEGE
jgi:hypothetical protein